MNRGWLICTVALAVLSAAWASEVFEPVQDSYTVYSYDHGEVSGTDENHGDSITLSVEYIYESSDEYGWMNTYIQFDLSSIEPGTTVLEADLSMWIYGWPSMWQLFEVADDWDEMEITYSTAPDQGGLIMTITNPPTGFSSFDFPTDVAQDWVDDPSHNFGLEIIEHYFSRFAVVQSRESSTPPQLELNLDDSRVQESSWGEIKAAF